MSSIINVWQLSSDRISWRISSFETGLLAARGSIGSDTRSGHTMGAYLKGIGYLKGISKGVRGWLERSSPLSASGDHTLIDCMTEISLGSMGTGHGT